MIVIASLAVAMVAFILYALDRRSKGESIDYAQAFKVSLVGGVLTSGVIFATTTDGVIDVVKNLEVPAVQDMFVGTPSF